MVKNHPSLAETGGNTMLDMMSTNGIDRATHRTLNRSPYGPFRFFEMWPVLYVMETKLEKCEIDLIVISYANSIIKSSLAML